MKNMPTKELVEFAQRWLEEDSIDEQNYYEKELNKLLPLDEYGVSIKLSSTKYQTKTMTLNRQSIRALEDFLKEIIVKNDEENVNKFVDQTNHKQ